MARTAKLYLFGFFQDHDVPHGQQEQGEQYKSAYAERLEHSVA
jgi:hypothetical protein